LCCEEEFATSVVLFLIVSFLASVAGAVCGIGGGIIMKPALDLLRLADAAAISFLSSCTVLAMSFYSVLRTAMDKDGSVDYKISTPLAIGGALGGVAGNYIFSLGKNLLGNNNLVGAVQSVLLALISAGVMLYRFKADAITTKNVKHALACLVIGLSLGVVSSFLGIGGGPLNLVVFFFFFSMRTKTAAKNSLYVILFSQAANMLTALLTGRLPAFEPLALVLMIAGGLLGGFAGRLLNRRMSEQRVEKLFMGLMVLILLISVYNTYTFIAMSHV